MGSKIESEEIFVQKKNIEFSRKKVPVVIHTILIEIFCFSLSSSHHFSIFTVFFVRFSSFCVFLSLFLPVPSEASDAPDQDQQRQPEKVHPAPRDELHRQKRANRISDRNEKSCHHVHKPNLQKVFLRSAGQPGERVLHRDLQVSEISGCTRKETYFHLQERGAL